MRIGELSRMTGASQRSLRLYEARGLIHAERSANGYRTFPADAVERVRFIQDLLGCGFSTREIRDFLPCFEDGDSDPACASGRKRYLKKLSQVETLLAELEQRRHALLRRVERMGASAVGEGRRKVVRNPLEMLNGSVLRYERPLDPLAIDEDEWDALK